MCACGGYPTCTFFCLCSSGLGEGRPALFSRSPAYREVANIRGLRREKGVMASVSRQPENPILILVLSEGRCGGTRGTYLLGGKLKARRFLPAGLQHYSFTVSAKTVRAETTCFAICAAGKQGWPGCAPCCTSARGRWRKPAGWKTPKPSISR